MCYNVDVKERGRIMKVLIATKNQGKIEGARRALAHYFDDFEIEGIPAPSEVSEQPLNADTYLGAKNRIKNLKAYCKQNGIEADLYLAIESGIYNSFGSYAITNVATIEDNGDFKSFGTSASFPVPEQYVQEVIDTNLSDVMDKVFGKDGERHNMGGGIQLLTKNVISRIDLTEQAFVMALTRYINKFWN